MLKFIVYGNPIPKARPRMTKTGHVYTPATTKAFEFLVQQVWNGQRGKKLITGPIGIYILFVLPKPKSVKNRLYPVVKPDLDNLVKSVLDGLNGFAYKDDCQIIDISAAKRYCGDHPTDKPRTHINIEELT